MSIAKLYRARCPIVEDHGGSSNMASDYPDSEPVESAELENELDIEDKRHRRIIKQHEEEVKKELEEQRTKQRELAEKEEGARNRLVEGYKRQGIDLEALWRLEDEIIGEIEEEVEDERLELSEGPSYAFKPLTFSDQITSLKPFFTAFYYDAADYTPGGPNPDLKDSSDIPNITAVFQRSCKGERAQIKANDCEKRTFVDRWFRYTPHATGYHIFHIYQPYDGKMTVKANSLVGNTRWARVAIWNEAQSYHTNKTREWTRFEVGGNKIDHDKEYVYLDHRPFEAYMDKDETALIRVTQQFYVNARGKGSFAKVDFQSGSHHVGSPTIYVTPPPI